MRRAKSVRVKFDNLDSMLPGNLLLLLYKETKDPKYKLAADRIRKRFNTYPRTKDGGFWHANRQESRMAVVGRRRVHVDAVFGAVWQACLAIANTLMTRPQINYHLYHSLERSKDRLDVSRLRRERTIDLG